MTEPKMNRCESVGCRERATKNRLCEYHNRTGPWTTQEKKCVKHDVRLRITGTPSKQIVTRYCKKCGKVLKG